MNIRECKNGNSHITLEEPMSFEEFITSDYLHMNDYKLIPTESGGTAIVNDRRSIIYTIEIYGSSCISEIIEGKRLILYPYKHTLPYHEVIEMYDEKGYLEW